MGNEIATATAGELATTAQEALIQIVLDGVTSEHTKRAYRRALSDFLAWHTEQGRPALCKALVQRYRAALETGQAIDAAQSVKAGALVYLPPQGAASVNLRLSAIRKLAQEASDNGALPEQVANGIKNVAGVKQEGTRAGNWLTKEQAQALLNAPDVTTLKGLRDRALLAVLLGCGLRRAEAAGLEWRHIQQREGRWIVVDLVGKRGKVRSVPMPSWCKTALDAWAVGCGLALGGLAVNAGRVFRSVNKGDHLSGDGMTAQAIRDVVTGYAAALGFGEIAPHDLRRTFAKLARKGGADLEQIQLSLGHASVQTTQKYLGTRQDLTDAPADRLGLRLES
jgi:site-specific recombinase XerD